MKERVDRLQEMIDVQCSDGNWNYDPYMHGMANGMIFAKSMFADEAPEYLEAPKEWLKDRDDEEVKTMEITHLEDQKKSD